MVFGAFAREIRDIKLYITFLKFQRSRIFNVGTIASLQIGQVTNYNPFAGIGTLASLKTIHFWHILIIKL